MTSLQYCLSRKGQSLYLLLFRSFKFYLSDDLVFSYCSCTYFGRFIPSYLVFFEVLAKGPFFFNFILFFYMPCINNVNYHILTSIQLCFYGALVILIHL